MSKQVITCIRCFGESQSKMVRKDALKLTSSTPGHTKSSAVHGAIPFESNPETRYVTSTHKTNKELLKTKWVGRTETLWPQQHMRKELTIPSFSPRTKGLEPTSSSTHFKTFIQEMGP